jgi:hypothetical protein
MGSSRRRLAVATAAALLGGLLLAAPAARAHLGPPFPILTDQRVGPYVASVWTDPNIGTGIFIVMLDAPEGGRLPAWTEVRVGVQPVSKRLPEVVYRAEPQRARKGARFYTTVAFDRGETWRVRVLIDGSDGGGTLLSEVEATPPGAIGPISFLIYGFPFAGVGFLWIKAVLRRRQAPAPGPPRAPGP